MQLPDIKTTEAIIFIIGLPASGKTFFTDLLSNHLKTHTVLHTDDYIKFGKHGELAECVTDINRAKRKRQPIIVEGVLCYRILKSRHINPDLIIIINASRDERVERYKQRNKSYSRDFDGMLIRFWKDYCEDLNWNGETFPRIIDWNKESLDTEVI